jgi:cysteine synthase
MPPRATTGPPTPRLRLSPTIVMPEHMPTEQRKMQALFGANLVLTPKELGGTKGTIDIA